MLNDKPERTGIVPAISSLAGATVGVAEVTGRKIWLNLKNMMTKEKGLSEQSTKEEGRVRAKKKGREPAKKKRKGNIDFFNY